jgi:hypothetical protein
MKLIIYGAIIVLLLGGASTAFNFTETDKEWQISVDKQLFTTASFKGIEKVKEITNNIKTGEQ